MMTIQWSIYDMVHLCSSSSDIANQVEYYENKLVSFERLIINYSIMYMLVLKVFYTYSGEERGSYCQLFPIGTR